MQLNSLSISSLRNLQSLHLDLHPHFNIVCGENGSGKTSLLEAIHLLATGRSFRATQARQVISFGKNACVVSGLVQPSVDVNNGSAIRMGVERLQNGGINMRVAEQDCHSIAELAKYLPLQLINSESYEILEASPKYRRQFLDWILFHVEQGFYPVWQRFKRALQQRNAALKKGRACSHQEVKVWDNELITTGLEIDRYRKSIINELTPFFAEVIGGLLKIKGEIHLQYLCGWNEERDLSEALNRSFERDMAFGHTTVGPHRAEIEFFIEGVLAKTVLSRGQSKLFICALLMARATLLARRNGRRCLFLIDDLGAELDAEASAHLLDALFGLGSQVVVTCIDPKSLFGVLGDKDNSRFEIRDGVFV